MLKLMRFPQGTNHNRTLKRVADPDAAQISTDAGVQHLFRRFWRERERVAANGKTRST